MALIMKYIDGIQEIFDKNGDPRTSNWPLMSSPFPTLVICLSYIYLVKVLGPKIMENRKPFQLKEVLIAYNLFQVIFSAWLFYEMPITPLVQLEEYFKQNICIHCPITLHISTCLYPPSTISGLYTDITDHHRFLFGFESVTSSPVLLGGWSEQKQCLMGGWAGEYSFRCQPVDYSDHPTTMRLGASGWFTGHYSLRCQPVDYSADKFTVRMVHVCWWYYFSKFTEFMDTIFFVLRKKNEHISTLHVIHHGCMPMSVWFGVKFTPGGHSTFFGLLNTFVHIIMYSYYLLAALGPSVQKYLWWKKYLTSLQMAQFIAIMVHAFQLLFIDCNYPKAFVWWIGMHAVMFFFLFKEFYTQSYIKERNRKAARSMKEAVLAAATICTPDQHVHQNGKSATNGHAKNYSKQSDYYVSAELNGSTLHHRRMD